MKRYIRSNRNQNILDNLVNGNQIWDPFEGRYVTISEERLSELRNPKPALLDSLELSKYYFYKNGKLYRRTVAGEFPEDDHIYRNAGRYKIYLNSFRDAALPYSKLMIADSSTGKVYEKEVTQGITDFRQNITELVEWLKAGNEIIF